MLNNFKILSLIVISLSLVACAGGGGNNFPNSRSGNLEQAKAARAMALLTGSLGNMLVVPSGNNVATDFGISLPNGYEDPDTPASFTGLLADPYAGCINVTTSPYLKYVMNCRSVFDSGVYYDYVGTIEYIKNNTTAGAVDVHYAFDYLWKQSNAAGEGEGGEFEGYYKFTDNGTTSKIDSKLNKTWVDNRSGTQGTHCTGGTCDTKYSIITNWTIEIDNTSGAMSAKGFLAMKGKNNYSNPGFEGWDGEIDVSFELELDNFMVNSGSGAIQSGTMKLTDGTGNKIAITWTGGMVTSTSYNGMGL